MKTVPNTHVRALLLDDDPWSQRLLRGMLRECFPMLRVDARFEPVVEPGYQIYFLDNDFDGRLVAAEMAREIREQSPDALVIAFSGVLDRSTLMQLLNAGCDGVCDKREMEDLPNLMSVLQRYIETIVAAQNERPRGGTLRESMRAVCDLLREWNTRLDREEVRDAAGA